MQWLALCAATRPFLSVQKRVLQYGAYWLSGAADLLASEVSGTQFGKCCVITVVWFVGWANQCSGLSCL